jgi:hypothetical protein
MERPEQRPEKKGGRSPPDHTQSTTLDDISASIRRSCERDYYRSLYPKS